MIILFCWACKSMTTLPLDDLLIFHETFPSSFFSIAYFSWPYNSISFSFFLFLKKIMSQYYDSLSDNNFILFSFATRGKFSFPFIFIKFLTRFIFNIISLYKTDRAFSFDKMSKVEEIFMRSGNFIYFLKIVFIRLFICLLLSYTIV